MDEALFYFGDTLKALDDKGRIGGYAVRFTDREHRDLYGDYFTKDTYLGAHQGDGVDVLFHHGMPLHTTRRMTEEQKRSLEAFRNHIFSSPTKAKKDETGLFVEVVLDMANAYEEAVYGLTKAGKLGWSSGSTWHMMRRTDDGEITRWPIIEVSMTPQPAEKLNRVVTLKSLESLKFAPLDDAPVSDDASESPNQPITEDAEQQVAAFDGLDIDTHSQLTVVAMRGITSRFRGNHESRKKDGRVLSERNRQRITSWIGHGKAVIADLQTLLDESAGATDNAEKRAKEAAEFMAKYRHGRR
jgi:hypothetical protein